MREPRRTMSAYPNTDMPFSPTQRTQTGAFNEERARHSGLINKLTMASKTLSLLGLLLIAMIVVSSAVEFKKEEAKADVDQFGGGRYPGPGDRGRGRGGFPGPWRPPPPWRRPCRFTCCGRFRHRRTCWCCSETEYIASKKEHL
ncbi:uncharacterized protein LOC144708580 [Wolffia australiana]